MTDFVPPPPEKANEGNKPGSETRETLGQDAFNKPSEVKRVADTQPEQLRNPAQAFQTVFAELSAAKKGMIAVEDGIAKGDGPYAKGDQLKAYNQNLDQAQQHYAKAKLAADTFLWVCDKNGVPIEDPDGKPIPSKENIALHQQREILSQEIRKLATDQSPEGRQKLQLELQQVHQITDLLRSSGYARANNAFALMFHTADLKKPERDKYEVLADLLLQEGSKFDQLMSKDPRYLKHWLEAKAVVQAGRPDEQQAAKPDRPNQPANPGDKPPQPVNPGDKPPQPANPGDKPPTAQGSVAADGNQYFVNYKLGNTDYHLPTWTKENPDHSPAQPFVLAPGAAPRIDGMLKPVTIPDPKDNTKRLVLGIDSTNEQPKPINDADGMRRLVGGGPVPALMDGSDPMFMLSRLEPAVLMQDPRDSKKIIARPLTDETRAAFNKVIESADKIDRVALANAIDIDMQIIKQNPEAAQWERNFRDLNAAHDIISAGLKAETQGLPKAQLDALGAMFEHVTTPGDLDKWMADPANKGSTDALLAIPKWTEVKAHYINFLNKEAEIRTQKSELDKNPALKQKVRDVRAADGVNQELARIFVSSVDTRAAYLTNLCQQDGVSKYMLNTDKNSAAAKELEKDPNVQEAKRVLAELAKLSPQFTSQLAQTAKGLGIELAKPVETPVQPTLPPKPEVGPPKPEVGPPKPEVGPPKPEVGPPKPEVGPPKPEVGPPKPEVGPPKPETGPPKPETGLPRTNDTSTQPAALDAPKPVAAFTDEQAKAPDVLRASYGEFKAATAGFTKPMNQEEFDKKLLPAWEKALEANASIKPEQIAAYEQQTQAVYQENMILALALQKSGKTSLSQIVEADLKNITKDELLKAMTGNVDAYLQKSKDLDNAISKLSPEDRDKYMAAKKFSTTMTQSRAAAITARDEAIKIAGADKVKVDAAIESYKKTIQAAYLPAYSEKAEAQKKLSPDVSAAIVAQDAFLSDHKGIFAKTFVESRQVFNAYKHAEEARLQIAQALVLQGTAARDAAIKAAGGDKAKEEVAQKAFDATQTKATQLVTTAMKNSPDVRTLLQSSQDGLKLLKDLNLKTPDMAKQEEELDKLFPEIKLLKEAKTAANWPDAKAKYEAAEKAIDDDIKERGKGRDLAESLQKVNEMVGSIQSMLGMALNGFKTGTRKLEPLRGETEEQVAGETKFIRDMMLGNPGATPPVPGMSQNDMEAALLGLKGPEAQKAMQRVLNLSELAMLDNLALLSQKVASVSAIRLEHAVKASEFGFNNNNPAAKKEAKDVLEGIKDIDLQTFLHSPEIQGALKRTENNTQMKLRDDQHRPVAAVASFDDESKKKIAQAETGIMEALLPGSGPAMNTLSIATTGGHYVSEIPYAGGALQAVFGGGTAEDRKVQVNLAAKRILENEDEARRLRDQTMHDSNSHLRGIAGDILGTGVTFGAGWGTNQAFKAFAAEAPGYVKIPAIVLAGLASGGLTNNAVSGNDLLASRGYIRNTVAAGTTYAAIKGLQNLPGRQTLSTELMNNLASKELTVNGAVIKNLVPEGVEMTGLEASKAISKSVVDVTKVGKMTQIVQALGPRLNPLTLTPFSWVGKANGYMRYVGYGGERTVQAFADGTLSLQALNARMFTGKALPTAAAGYIFGAANEAARLGTGEHLDGKKYDSFGAYWEDINKAGKNSALATSIMIPVVALPVASSLAKALTPGVVKRGLDTGINTAFSRAGLDVLGTRAAFGSAALMMAQPTLDGVSGFGRAVQYDQFYRMGQAEAERLRQLGAQQLDAAKKPATDK